MHTLPVRLPSSLYQQYLRTKLHLQQPNEQHLQLDSRVTSMSNTHAMQRANCLLQLLCVM
jgi:hypothetical protein